MKILILSQNCENYTGGYYQQDWINAFSKKYDCDIYGPGYFKYSLSDDINMVAAKFNKIIDEYDFIVTNPSWDRPGQKHNDDNVNIHPKINLSNIIG